MVVIYLFKSNIFSVESSPGGHGRDGKGRGKDIWFWLGFICRALLPVHVHYHGDFKGDEMFHYLQDFCFTLGTYSSERCGEKITIALLAMISTNWNQSVTPLFLRQWGPAGARVPLLSVPTCLWLWKSPAGYLVC